MIKTLIQTAIFVVLLPFSLIGCSHLLMHPVATLNPTPPATSSMTPPAATNIPARQPSPASSCNRDQVLVNLKAYFPYAEFAVNYNTIQGMDILSLWYVDPAIDPEVTNTDIEEYAALAIRDSIVLSQKVNFQDQCIEALFTIINPIVVDSSYHGWFSGSIDPSKLPRISNPTEAQINGAQEDIQMTYLRQQIPSPIQPAPDSACSWVDTRANIQRHFDSSRQNVSFEFVLDESAAHVDAQWDSDIGQFDEKTWWALQVAAMYNIAIELTCLYPAPTTLNIIVVNSTGKIELIGTLPEPNKPINEIDITKFQIIYQDLEWQTEPLTTGST